MGRGSVPKIKKSTIQNIDFFEIRGKGWICISDLYDLVTVLERARGGRSSNFQYSKFKIDHIFLRLSVHRAFEHTERFSLRTEESIKKMYFDSNNLKYNKAHIHVKIRVLKTSFSKSSF